MAQHLSLRLPIFKLRKRSTSGPSQSEAVHPTCGISCTDVKIVEDSDTESLSDDDQLDDPSGHGDEQAEVGDEFEGPSLYKIQQETAASGWKNIRSKLLRAAVEANAMPPEQVCINDCGTPASLRCLKCSLTSFYCHDCFISIHAHSNFFHVAEEWKVDFIFSHNIKIEQICMHFRRDVSIQDLLTVIVSNQNLYMSVPL